MFGTFFSGLDYIGTKHLFFECGRQLMIREYRRSTTSVYIHALLPIAIRWKSIGSIKKKVQIYK